MTDDEWNDCGMHHAKEPHRHEWVWFLLLLAVMAAAVAFRSC